MNLRPTNLDDIIGQEELVKRLRITVDSSIQRGEAMPHTLFEGPPGLGKTTLAVALANSRGVNIEVANGGNLKSVKSILPYLLKIEAGSVLFIDEIHRLPVSIEEFLYPVLEDFRMDVGSDNALSMDIPQFTMIGATTEAGALSRPFYDRFTYKFQLELYKVDTLSEIVTRSAETMGLEIEKDSAISVAKRSRGTPRVSNNLITWIRDYCQSGGHSKVTDKIVDEAMGMIGIDGEGVTGQDRAYLGALRKSANPMGLRSLVDATNMDADTIQNVVEPFLLRRGMIQRTPKGRIAV